MTEDAGYAADSEDAVDIVELDPFDEGDEDFPLPSRPGSSIRALAFSPPALALVAFATALVTMGQVQSGTEIADTHYESTNARHLTTLSVYRVSSGVRLSVAVVALIIAIIAAVRLRDAQVKEYLEQLEADAADDSHDLPDDVDLADTPLWVRSVVGAAVVIAVLAVVLAGVAFGYAMSAHATSAFNQAFG